MSDKIQNYANQAEILRCYMRDAYFIEYLQNATLELFYQFMPSSLLEKHNENIKMLIAFLYNCVFSINTGKTIGEEDSGIIMNLFMGNDSKIYRFLIRFIKFGINFIIPILLRKILTNYFTKLRNFDNEKYKELFEKFILCRFLLNGKYLTFADWVLKIRYKMVQTDFFAPILNYTYAGKIILFQLLFSAIKLGYNFINSWVQTSTEISQNNEKIDNKNTVFSETKKCPICLETRKNPSCAKCGHIFCWSCILEYVQIKSHCPICRKQCFPQDIIYLVNIE